MAIEEPRFKVLLQEDRLELRAYAMFTVAEVQVQGSFDEASRRGFRLIADYIFGNNQSIQQADRSEKIAMTAPVTVESKASIAIDAVAASRGDSGGSANSGSWRVHFVMPASYRLHNLPKPNNPAVKLREVEEGLYASIRFSGFTTESAIQERTEQLSQWIQSKAWIVTGNPQIARYNDPFTLPFNRRNEILIPVRRP